VESQPGLGTTFWFTCELGRDRGEVETLVVASQPGAQFSPVVAAVPVGSNSAGPRILLAEDNPVNRTVAVRWLKRLGYLVDVVADGAAAVAALAERTYPLVLMDCQMPVLDGFEAAAQIRASEGPGRRTTIVALTALAMPGDRERCLAAGTDDYVCKPVRIDTLRLVLERWLSGAARSDGQERQSSDG
jgi:CheY-like chemotaxis protein